MLLMLVGAGSARADVENPGLFPIGEREALMGNTGIAGTRSTGALYYNPAALAELSGLTLSVSGSAYLGYSIKSEPFVEIDNTALSFEASGLTVIPSSTVSVHSLGGDNVLALGILIPEALEFNDHQMFTTPNTQTDLTLSSQSQEMRLGGALAWKQSEEVSLGVGLFLVRFAENSQSTVTSQSTSQVNTVSVEQAYKDESIYSALLTAGVQWRVKPDLKLGATMKFPTLKLGGKAKVLTVSNLVEAGVLTTSRFQNDDATVNYGTPFDLGLGLAWKMNLKTTLLFDLSFQAPVEFTDVPEDPNSISTKTKFMPRFNLGGRFQFSEVWGWSLGTFYNPSTLSADANASAVDQPSNFWGFSTGVEYFSGRTRTTLGFFYAHAGGQKDLGTFTSKMTVNLTAALIGFTYFL